MLGRRLPGVAARLDDYARHRVRGELFPAIVPRSGASTPGTLLRTLAPDDLARLDSFEGALYRRSTVEVCLDGGHAHGSPGTERAFTYVLRARYADRLSDDAWSRARLHREWLPILLERWRS